MPNWASTVHTIKTTSALTTKIRFTGVVWEGENSIFWTNGLGVSGVCDTVKSFGADG